ncbi:MAG: NAD(P)/FAD-dependent oxidoreductase [Bacteroidales bacterium]|nr:NAD(P)/FAD-dependent oxidoreductase [Bacteroidales bacterium]
MKRIAIIGAGASGLLLAKLLADRTDMQTCLFEQSSKVGFKVRASGGGRANLFNQNVTPECYNHPDFIRSLLNKVGPEKLWRTFEAMGLLLTADEEGRVYPVTQFSQTVVDVLWSPDTPNFHTELEYEVRKISRQGTQWHINDYPVSFDAVVFATGSPASLPHARQERHNTFLTDFNLKTRPLEPSLVGFKLARYPRRLSGCRVKVDAALYYNNALIHKEKGEVTFKDDGISGIVILNLSAFYNRLADKRNCEIELNLLPDCEVDIEQYKRDFGSLKGILHPKLNAWYEQHPFDVKKMKWTILEPYGLEFAQVCHGGIDLSEVDEHFALKRFPGLYAAGEMIDVDGLCGGYNLFFAFASAIVIAQSL